MMIDIFDVTEWQLILSAIVAIGLWKLRIFNQRVPRVVLLLATVCAVVFTGFSGSRFFKSDNGLEIARLDSDPFERSSRKFRRIISDFLRSNPYYDENFSLGDLHASIASAQEAQQVLKTHPQLALLIWGDQHWLRISFPEIEPRDLETLGKSLDVDGIRNLKLVLSVPMAGLSFAPQLPSARFIGKLYAAIVAQREFARTSEPRHADRAQILLREAGSQEAFWTSFAHRAVAWWLLGNEHFLAAFRDETVQVGELKCALDAYRSVLRYLKKNDNTELLAATLNNLGVAIVVLAMYNRESQATSDMIKEAMDCWRDALLTLHQNNRDGLKFKSARIAKQNMVTLRDELRKRNKKERGKLHVNR
ncbi:MAG: hypothetical protein KDD42_00625 [Bdellovibrionales bacterium]|nr:hypothetical protein [Bdellovibrionales bacterium]